MELIAILLMKTPLWVYLLLAVLLMMGFKASKTGVVNIKKMLIAPIVFTLMSIESLYTHLSITFYVLGLYVGALSVGIGLGFLQVNRLKLKVDQKNGLIEIPGSWSVMVLILIIFSTKYYFGYELSVDPHALDNSEFEVLFISVNAICTGLFIGKTIGFYKQLISGPSQTLAVSSD
jgi:hypothetical protein